MSDQLVITKEKVLEAAAKCSTAKEVLKTIFPEAFEEKGKFFNLRPLEITRVDGFDGLLFDNIKSQIAGFKNNGFMQIRNVGVLKDKAFYLSNDYDWELSKEKLDNATILIPTKKSNEIHNQ